MGLPQSDKACQPRAALARPLIRAPCGGSVEVGRGAYECVHDAECCRAETCLDSVSLLVYSNSLMCFVIVRILASLSATESERHGVRAPLGREVWWWVDVWRTTLGACVGAKGQLRTGTRERLRARFLHSPIRGVGKVTVAQVHGPKVGRGVRRRQHRQLCSAPPLTPLVRRLGDKTSFIKTHHLVPPPWSPDRKSVV